jgi:acyl-CoA synthetase (AMP-forming)/AMP-acid ligase II
LTFTQADRAVSGFAARLRMLGLQADAVVGLQLPNTAESVIALLGVLRAGMIAALLPLLWRKRDLLNALTRAGASAIVTTGRTGNLPHADIATQVAAELFGTAGADGVVSLNEFSTRLCQTSLRHRIASSSARMWPCSLSRRARMHCG